jgi:hypothetical protein
VILRGDDAVAAGRLHARGRGGDVPVSAPVAVAARFRGDKVVRWQSCGSREEALAALEASAP